MSKQDLNGSCRWRRRDPRQVAIALVVLFAACGGPERVTVRQPLITGSQAPLVLTESETVASPASLEPNRFVRGWWPYGGKGRRSLAALDDARIQGVNLARVHRRLVLVCDEETGDRPVDVRIEGGPWTRMTADKRLHVPLPKDLPLGRFVVDFRSVGEEPLGVRLASFSKAAEAGDVEFIDEDVVQSGFSIVETVHKIEGPTTLVGAFRPPQDAIPAQRFSLRVRTSGDDAETEVFAWSAEEPSAQLEFSIPLASEAGLVGVRMIALGAGPAARWQSLALESLVTETPAVEVVVPRPPKVVVLYIMDALRRDYLGHLGGPDGVSPTIDRLAAEGATFDNFFSIAPNTVPSMKSLVSGKVFLDTGSLKLPSDVVTLAERYWEAGYRTAVFSSNGNVSSWRGVTQGYEHNTGGLLFGSKKRRGYAGYNDSAELLHRVAIEWLESLDPDESVFMHIQTINPHNPFDPPEPFRSRFASVDESTIQGGTELLKQVARGKLEVSEADKERIRGLYAGSVAYNDHHLSDFLDQLLERYDPEEILLVLTSDHGEELFERESLLHGYTLYDEQLLIPLVVWWPGVVEAGVIEETGVNLDLHATLAALVDGTEGDLGGGRSLWPLLLGADPQAFEDQEIVFAAASSLKGGVYMARSDRMKSIYAPQTGRNWGMGIGKGRTRDPEYLFDLNADPAEKENIAGDRRLEADWLRSRLLAWIDIGKQLETGVPLDEMDEETRDSLRALGYLQ